jgi:hypothetical protein
MNRRTPKGRSAPACAAALAACCALVFWPFAASAAGAPGKGDKGDKDGKGKPGPGDVRHALGQVASPSATVLLCEGPDKSCRVLRERGLVFAGDRLLTLPGQRGDVDLDGGNLRLSLLGNLPEGKDKILQSAVTVRAPSPKRRVILVTDGRALVANRKKKGALKVSVDFAGEEGLDLELIEPGAEVALELVTHWPPGAPFRKEPKEGHRPEVDGFLFVVKGEVNVKLDDGTEHNGLKAPTLFHFNSFRGLVGPLAVKEAPAWARVAATPKGETAKALEQFRKALAKGGVGEYLPQARADKSPLVRTQAVYALAAAGDLPRVVRALADAKDREARRAAVTALGHWSGQGAAADVALYRALLKEKLAPVEAETVVGLLHPFKRQDLDQRETYETLIDYLTHPRPAVRELAAWHLARLVPEAKGIIYDAGGTEQERAKAQAAWRKLLKEGKLPPK